VRIVLHDKDVNGEATRSRFTLEMLRTDSVIIQFASYYHNKRQQRTAVRQIIQEERRQCIFHRQSQTGTIAWKECNGNEHVLIKLRKRCEANLVVAEIEQGVYVLQEHCANI
jgi:hypothetical protein